MVAINPTEKKDYHAKIYVEDSVAQAIKDFQKQKGYFSFSEAGRHLLLDGLEFNARNNRL